MKHGNIRAGNQNMLMPSVMSVQHQLQGSHSRLYEDDITYSTLMKVGFHQYSLILRKFRYAIITLIITIFLYSIITLSHCLIVTHCRLQQKPLFMIDSRGRKEEKEHELSGQCDLGD